MEVLLPTPVSGWGLVLLATAHPSCMADLHHAHLVHQWWREWREWRRGIHGDRDHRVFLDELSSRAIPLGVKPPKIARKKPRLWR